MDWIIDCVFEFATEHPRLAMIAISVVGVGMILFVVWGQPR